MNLMDDANRLEPLQPIAVIQCTIRSLHSVPLWKRKFEAEFRLKKISILLIKNKMAGMYV